MEYVFPINAYYTLFPFLNACNCSTVVNTINSLLRIRFEAEIDFEALE